MLECEALCDKDAKCSCVTTGATQGKTEGNCYIRYHCTPDSFEKTGSFDTYVKNGRTCVSRPLHHAGNLGRQVRQERHGARRRAAGPPAAHAARADGRLARHVRDTIEPRLRRIGASCAACRDRYETRPPEHLPHADVVAGTCRSARRATTARGPAAGCPARGNGSAASESRARTHLIPRAAPADQQIDAPHLAPGTRLKAPTGATTRGAATARARTAGRSINRRTTPSEGRSRYARHPSPPGLPLARAAGAACMRTLAAHR